MDQAPAGRRKLGIDDGRSLSPLRGSAIAVGPTNPGLTPGATICRPYGTYRRDAKHVPGGGRCNDRGREPELMSSSPPCPKDVGHPAGATICRPYGTYRRDAKHVPGGGRCNNRGREPELMSSSPPCPKDMGHPAGALLTQQWHTVWLIRGRVNHRAAGGNDCGVPPVHRTSCPSPILPPRMSVGVLYVRRAEGRGTLLHSRSNSVTVPCCSATAERVCQPA